ncbi:hypothetical protein Patl1_28374 [Pistacia atlantica]|uniref:Uncharacterized protein n=1 Tax=Pistacia atlantica TaxID=434234 RepID=A0ACC1BCA3_9ROSI|nr:hypothetical protein Patl1_28374 [Pistacia atlantica]
MSISVGEPSIKSQCICGIMPLGRVTDFTSSFSFAVASGDEDLPGARLSFFLTTNGSIMLPNSSGGFLGLVTGNNDSTNSTKNHSVAVEFDNQFVGVHINSTGSEFRRLPSTTAQKRLNVLVEYNSSTKYLCVTLIDQADYTVLSGILNLCSKLDLINYLPEWVTIGFSAGAGEFTRTYSIYSWQFSSNLKANFEAQNGTNCGNKKTKEEERWKSATKSSADQRLLGDFQVEPLKRLMMLGLWCAHPDHRLRPSIRQAIQVLNYEAEIPILPKMMPVAIYHEPNSSSSSSQAFMTFTSANLVSFNYSCFPINTPNILFEGDAFPSNDVLQLRKNQADKNLIRSVGRATYNQPVTIWDAKTGKLTDFTAHFSFIIKALNTSNNGDGIAFFFAPFDSTIPDNSTGGYLALFSPDTAKTNTSKQIVAVEFDSFQNEWDPSSDHEGVNVNSIISVATVDWKSSIKNGSMANAWVSYNSGTQNLSVFLTYADKPVFSGNSSLWYIVDLREVLPERVKVGFSASTSEVVEIHNIISWSFSSTLDETSP